MFIFKHLNTCWIRWTIVV